MEILIGFLIALSIGLTGVGGGVITAPVLILFLHLPASLAVGTSLVFVAAVKMFAVPVYFWRKQIDFRVLRYLLAGGVPGVLAGSFLLRKLNAGRETGIVLAAVGAIVVVSAAMTLLRYAFRREPIANRNRYGLLALTAALIGLEVGFSSAGAGALGTVVLLQLTTLSAAEVVGTDLLFGFALALLGGGFHFVEGSFSAPLAVKLILGGIFGAALGAYAAGLVPKRLLRMGMAVWLVWLGAELWLRGIAVLAHG